MATVLEDVTCRIGADITSFRTNLGEASALGSRFAYDLTRATRRLRAAPSPTC